MGNKHKVGTVFLQRILTDSAFLLRREIVLTAVVFLGQMVLKEYLVHLAQFPCRYIGRQFRSSSTEQVQFVCAIVLHTVDDIVQQCSLKRHHILLTFDKAHLHIKRDILVQVARSVMLFCAVGGCNLKDTLIHAHTYLFIELRRLCQIDLFAEIVQLKHVGTTLSPLRNNLRSINLRKAVLGQKIGKRLGYGRLHFQNRHIAWVTECNLTVVELKAEHRFLVTKLQRIDIHHLGGSRTRQNTHAGNGYLYGIVERSRVFDLCLVHRTLDRYCHLTTKPIERNFLTALVIETGSLVLYYCLQQTARLTQNDKPTPLRDTDIVNHTAYNDGITGFAVVYRCLSSVVLS